jgi:hypothetical protein
MTASQDLTNITFYNIQPDSYSYVQDSTKTATTTPTPAAAVDSAKKKN